MSYSNGRITDPVSIVDVQKALDVQSSGLRTLCEHAKINKWAKFKPMRFNGIMSPTPAQRSASTGDQWPHGLVYPFYSDNVADLESEGEIAQNIMDGWSGLTPDQKSTYDGWTYLTPRGVVNANLSEFFRLHDYANVSNPGITGYYNGATIPCKVYLKGFSYTDADSSFRYVVKDNISYLDINTAARSSLTFGIEVYVREGGEVSLQEIFASANYSNFRFFVTLFEEGRASNIWYASDNIRTCEDVNITFMDQSGYNYVEVEVPLTGLVEANQEKKYRAVAGMITTRSSNDLYVLMPQTEKNTSNTPSKVWDFYYPLLLSYHLNQYRTLHPLGLSVQGVGFDISATNVTGTSWNLPYTSISTSNRGLFNFEINKYDSGVSTQDKLYFIGEHGTAPSDGRPLYIKAIREGMTSVAYWLEPSNSSWQTISDGYIEIPQGQQTEWVSMYGKLPTSTGGQEDFFPGYRSGLRITVRLFMYIGGTNVEPIENAVMNISYVNPNS
jgi:hypothetical protein